MKVALVAMNRDQSLDLKVKTIIPYEIKLLQSQLPSNPFYHIYLPLNDMLDNFRLSLGDNSKTKDILTSSQSPFFFHETTQFQPKNATLLNEVLQQTNSNNLLSNSSELTAYSSPIYSLVRSGFDGYESLNDTPESLTSSPFLTHSSISSSYPTFPLFSELILKNRGKNQHLSTSLLSFSLSGIIIQSTKRRQSKRIDFPLDDGISDRNSQAHLSRLLLQRDPKVRSIDLLHFQSQIIITFSDVCITFII
jgi:hypothetical protein